jgi:hypothetical protein
VFGNTFSRCSRRLSWWARRCIKGSTNFKPPSVEYRVTLAFNMNYVDVPERRVLFVEPSRGTTRFDHFVGVQEAFVDYHFTRIRQ